MQRLENFFGDGRPLERLTLASIQVARAKLFTKAGGLGLTPATDGRLASAVGSKSEALPPVPLDFTGPSD